MTAASISSTTAGRPPRVRFTLEQFERFGAAGVIDERIELVDGEVIVMPPVGNAHSIALQRIYNRLYRAWSEPRFVRTQATHRFADAWGPMPDIALLDEEPTPGASLDPLPRLVVEISDDSLAYDLGDKRLRFARAGVAEYWVADLKRRRILVFRSPDADAADPTGAYVDEQIIPTGGQVAPLCGPEAVIRVADVLPQAG